MLFADLSGFTSVAESMDPEEVHDVLVPLMERLGRVVESFGGAVVNVMGDGFMAVFGAPVAHPDDAERAVRAAFEARALVRASRNAPAFDLHAGVHTGWVSVAQGEAGLTVIGDTVNTASRIAGLADPGVVLAGESTRSLAARSIRFRDLEPVTVKGKAEPLRVFEALEVRNSALERFFEPAFTPLVGRERERRRLEQIFRATASGRRSAVSVIAGAPGIGKSRLARDFASSLEEATILVGRAMPFGERVGWLAIADALRGVADIADDDVADVATEKLWEFVERVLPDAPGEERAQLISRLGLLLRIEQAAAGSRAVPGEFNWEVAAALRRLFSGAAAQRPVVLIVEDLQWADPEVATFLRWVQDEPWEARVLVLGLVWEDALGDLGIDPASVTHLPTLARDDLDTLIRHLLPEAAVPAGVADDLVQRSAGNPLFLQEIIRLLREQNVLVAEPEQWVLLDAPRAQVPDSVHLVVAARIDGLGGDERRLVRDAAVCGATFTTSHLEALGWQTPHDLLAALEERGLIFRRRRDDGGEEFGFGHTVIRDVAYGSIPRGERAGKHLAVAEWLRRTAGDEPVELLAYHYAQATLVGLPGPAAGVRSQAVSFLTKAGDRALAQRALREAESWYRQAIELQPPSPARAHTPEGAATLAALVRHAEVLYDLGRYDDAREEASRALEMAGIAGDARSEGTAHLQLARLGSLFGDLAAARTMLRLADAKFREAGDEPGRAHVVRTEADTWRLSDIPRMIEGLQEAARLYRDAGDWRNEHFVREDLAYVHTSRATSSFDRHVRMSEPLVERAGDQRSRAAYLRTRGFHAFYLGRLDDAVEPLEAAMKLARDAGDVFVECDCMYALARIGFERADHDEARRLGRTLVRFGRSQGLRRIEEEGLVLLARVESRRGNHDEAARMLGHAESLLAGIGAEREMVEVVLATAVLALERGEWRPAGEAGSEYERRVRRFGDVLEIPRALVVQARAALGAGDHEAAGRLAADALDLADAEGQPDVREIGGAVRATALSLLGRPDDAAGLLRSIEPVPGYPERAAIRLEAHAWIAEARGDEIASRDAFAVAAAAWAALGDTVWARLARARLAALPRR